MENGIKTCVTDMESCTALWFHIRWSMEAKRADGRGIGNYPVRKKKVLFVFQIAIARFDSFLLSFFHLLLIIFHRTKPL